MEGTPSLWLHQVPGDGLCHGLGQRWGQRLDQWNHDVWMGAFEKTMIPHAQFEGVQDTVEVKKEPGSARGRGVDHPTIGAQTDRPW